MKRVAKKQAGHGVKGRKPGSDAPADRRGGRGTSGTARGQAGALVPTSEPPCPAEDPRAGDKTPEVVAWFFRYRPEEAEARYKGRKFGMPDL